MQATLQVTAAVGLWAAGLDVIDAVRWSVLALMGLTLASVPLYMAGAVLLVVLAGFLEEAATQAIRAAERVARLRGPR